MNQANKVVKLVAELSYCLGAWHLSHLLPCQLLATGIASTE